jgi:FkbM family methyltransferase
MKTAALPGFVRSTLGRVRVRGVPRILLSTSRLVLGNEPRLRRVAGGYDLHIDPRDGDQCMMYYGFYGAGILHFAEQILEPGDAVFDVGAQIGFFSGAFAQMVGPSGRVTAFEPDPRVWPRLLAGVQRNDHLPVTPMNVAVAGTSGDVTLHVSPTAGWSTLMDCDYPEVEAVSVPARALDDLIGAEDLGWERLRLIKIDVEGAELAALEGMRELLTKYQPHLVCEMNAGCLRDSGHSPEALLGLLDNLGYSAQAILEPRGFFRGGEPDVVDVRSERDLPWAVGDLLCTPRGDL